MKDRAHPGGPARTALGALDEGLAEGAGAFASAEREVAWTTMRHRGGEVPRLVAIQGERAPDGAVPLYRHPADEQPELRAFTPAVDHIRREVERRVGHPLNHCLLQLYRTGRDWISEHSDKTLDRRRRLPPRLRGAQLPHLAGARRRRVSAGRAVYFVNGSISS